MKNNTKKTYLPPKLTVVTIQMEETIAATSVVTIQGPIQEEWIEEEIDFGKQEW